MDSGDIELGNEPIRVERKPRSGVVISVRLSPVEADELQTIAAARRATLSQIAREAITGYLNSRPVIPIGHSDWTGTTSGNVRFEMFSSPGTLGRTLGPKQGTLVYKDAPSPI